jgi:cytochrome b subunit of formate dehydrogenase/bacterioferritin-associated ferredoxin
MQLEISSWRSCTRAILGLMAAWLLSGGLAAVSAQQAAPAAAPASAATPAAASASKLDNADCLSCHDTKAKKIEVPAADGKPRALKTVPPEKFALGEHARMQCVACHANIADNAEKGSHAKVEGKAKPDCAGCHQQLQAEGKAAGKPGMEKVLTNVEEHKKSIHARPNADDKTRQNASCNDCHSAHTFKSVPAKGTPEFAAHRMGLAAQCGSCHDEQLEAYQASVHHKKNEEKKEGKAATCVDCHTAHTVTNTSGDAFKRDISTNCGNCHEERLKTFRDTFHGAVVTLGYTTPAKCYNCHGSHEILSNENPDSKVHPDNVLKTCRSCHNPKKGLHEVSAGFATFQPHADPYDIKKYPQVTMAYWGMIGLLVGTFGFFWLHTILWFIREYKERKARGGHAHVRLDEVPPAKREQHVVRFNSVQRTAHLIFALSLMTLTLTGMPLFFPTAPWAAALMKLLGGYTVAGYVHRVVAVVFAGVFIWHLFYVASRIMRNWRHFKFLGPDSLIPWIPDIKGIFAMFRWFLGKGPRPVFDRWTYWEKFDYWAPFWGVTIIGVSGLVMWLPHVFSRFLPGWVFNVATIMHGEEAFLAVVFLFTVHFFNNHFRPDKFPVDVVMFTGTQSLEEFKREHALEYQRLVDSGELDKRLVEPPSRFHVTASKALAFVLIVVGLSLLTMVGIGFFTQG